MQNDVFINYSNMNVDQIKNLIIRQKKELENKLNGLINFQEHENDGFLYWNCKMLLRNIYMACDKITNKYKDELSEEEISKYVNISTIIKNDENEWKNIDNVRDTFKKLSFDKKIVENEVNDDNAKGFLRKYKTDGTEEIVELPNINLKRDLPFTPEESKYYDKISKMLDIPILKCKEYSKTVEGIDATYYYNPNGEKMIIVSNDGSYLLISYEDLLKESKRIGKFE